ncbi:hypothetical protein M885DRAFT_506287 [Pelagophyceae sp. CCMP2097]|nr:hypothetical protein M885DRAFT_506287 [Pelagophyceae sp. CCMP2097]
MGWLRGGPPKGGKRGWTDGEDRRDYDVLRQKLRLPLLAATGIAMACFLPEMAVRRAPEAVSKQIQARPMQECAAAGDGPRLEYEWLLRESAIDDQAEDVAPWATAFRIPTRRVIPEILRLGQQTSEFIAKGVDDHGVGIIEGILDRKLCAKARNAALVVIDDVLSPSGAKLAGVQAAPPVDGDVRVAIVQREAASTAQQAMDPYLKVAERAYRDLDDALRFAELKLRPLADELVGYGMLVERSVEMSFVGGESAAAPRPDTTGSRRKLFTFYVALDDNEPLFDPVWVSADHQGAVSPPHKAGMVLVADAAIPRRPVAPPAEPRLWLRLSYASSAPLPPSRAYVSSIAAAGATVVRPELEWLRAFIDIYRNVTAPLAQYGKYVMQLGFGFIFFTTIKSLRSIVHAETGAGPRKPTEDEDDD